MPNLAAIIQKHSELTVMMERYRIDPRYNEIMTTALNANLPTKQPLMDYEDAMSLATNLPSLTEALELEKNTPQHLHVNTWVVLYELRNSHTQSVTCEIKRLAARSGKISTSPYGGAASTGHATNPHALMATTPTAPVAVYHNTQSEEEHTTHSL